MSYDPDPPDTRTDMEKAAEAFTYVAACVRLRGRRLEREYIRSRFAIAPPLTFSTKELGELP